MAKTKNHSAKFGTRAALEALRSEATLAEPATKHEIRLKAWTIRATK